MLTGLDDWILRCRKMVDASKEPPYLDDIYPELEPEEQRDRPWSAVSEEYCRTAERLLCDQPSDMALRFALLHPSYPTDRGPRRAVFAKEREQRRDYFRHLVTLCIPEELTDLRTLKFELHNSYLASNWVLMKQLLSRVESLELLSPGEMKALQGHTTNSS